MNLQRLIALLPIAVAVSTAHMVVHESRSASPDGFTSLGAAPADEIITLRVGLASNDMAGLERKALSVSTPGSSDFRQWLSMEEVKSFVQPSTETIAAFKSFAASNDLEHSVISPNGEWLSVSLPVSKANELFAATFEKFSHPSLKTALTRTLSLSLPSSLVGHVDVLHPAMDFSIPISRPQTSAINPVPKRAAAASCNTAGNNGAGVITPACLQAIYGIPTTPATVKSNNLLVTGYIGEYAQTADLTAFLKALRPDIPSNTTFAVQTIDGATNPQDALDAGYEGDLDTQYAVGIATGLPVSYLGVGGPGSGFATAVLDTNTYVDGLQNPPSVITTSYGTAEANVASAMATKVCNSYLALNARGISSIFVSGDGGPRAVHDNSTTCASNTFIPIFPASCPYVTVVGGTQGFAPEVATNLTGGGFSNYFTTPSYQTAEVASFLKTLPANFAGTFNRSGRGYPDVALQALHYQTVVGGETVIQSGTSASAPAFAAIIALINDRLVAAGKPTLGFLNPWIYKNTAAFTDVTSGHNSGYTCAPSTVAFDAVTGWDPLTGVGSPIFDRLLASAMAA